MIELESDARMPESSRHPAVLTILLPILFVAFVFAGTLSLGLVWDDGSLSMLPVYRLCDLEAILTSPANGFEYLPVRDLSLCVDHALWGKSTSGFHGQNLFWFALSCLLLGSLYRTLFEASGEAVVRERAGALGLICASVFALHPLQVEPVAFITARNALLSLFFLLSTLVCYARFAKTGSIPIYLLSVLFTFFALFSKATALPTALLVVLLHAYLKRDDKPLRALLHAAPHFVVTALAASIHLILASTHGAMSSAPGLADLVSRLPRAAFVPGFYLYKFIWPASQSVEYVLTGVQENLVASGLAAFAFFVAAGWIVLRGLRARSLSSYLCVAYFCALLPVLNLFPTYPPVADRYVQIPLVFLTPLFIVPILNFLPLRGAQVAAVLIVTVLGALSHRQVPVWTSDETLFAHAVEMDPRSLVSLENLAHTRWWRGAEEEALEAFELIAQQRPEDGQLPLFRAWHAVHQGDDATAEKQLEIARSRNATPYVAYMIRAELHLKNGRNKSAVRDYERARADAQKHVQRDARARGRLIEIERALRGLRTRVR